MKKSLVIVVVLSLVMVVTLATPVLASPIKVPLNNYGVETGTGTATFSFGRNHQVKVTVALKGMQVDTQYNVWLDDGVGSDELLATVSSNARGSIRSSTVTNSYVNLYGQYGFRVWVAQVGNGSNYYLSSNPEPYTDGYVWYTFD